MRVRRKSAIAFVFFLLSLAAAPLFTQTATTYVWQVGTACIESHRMPVVEPGIPAESG